MIYEQLNQKYSLKHFSNLWKVNLNSPKHRIEYYADSEWSEVLTEQKNWCRKYCKGDVYITSNCNRCRKVYCFQFKEDAMGFKLRWK